MGKRKETRLIVNKVKLPDGSIVTEAGVYKRSDSVDVPIAMRLQVSPGIEVKEGESLTVGIKQIIEGGKTVAAGMILAKTEDDKAPPSPEEAEGKLLTRRSRRRIQAKESHSAVSIL